MTDYFIIFDTETTGVTPQDSVCQIAALRVNSHDLSVQGACNTLINPQRPINPHATTIHGITDEMVQDAPTLAQTFDRVLHQWFSQAQTICGHNVAFDLRMCQSVLPTPNNTLDTLTLARLLYPRHKPPHLPNHKLNTLQRYLHLPERQAHDALSDCLTCLDFLKLISQGNALQHIQELAHQPLKELKAKALQLNP